jgi:hypothetical protein
MSKTRASLLKRLAGLAARAMQGSLSEVFLPCGKKTCGCRDDRQRWHGPHLYLKFKTPEGKQTSIYVPRGHEKQVRQAAEAWRSLWDTIVALSDQNREALREQVRRRKDA